MAKVALRLVGMTEAQSDENLFLMLLREINGDRHLPVLLGVSEAHMVSLAKRGMSPLRPMFFESFGQAFMQFDIELMECYIYNFEREIYSCYLIFRQQDKSVTVDARLSDALALAIYMDASIYAEEEMLNKIQERLVVRERKDDLRRLDITDLEEMLTDAVRDEDYEFASRLRDVIKERRCDEV